MKKNFHFILFTAVGAAIGAMLREVIVGTFHVEHSWMIIAAINSVGGFIIAVVYEIEHRLHENITIFSAIGFCGGFTTFSHFSYHTASMLKEGHVLIPLLNIFVSLSATLFACYLGVLAIELCRKIRRGL